MAEGGDVSGGGTHSAVGDGDGGKGISETSGPVPTHANDFYG